MNDNKLNETGPLPIISQSYIDYRIHANGEFYGKSYQTGMNDL